MLAPNSQKRASHLACLTSVESATPTRREAAHCVHTASARGEGVGRVLPGRVVYGAEGQSQHRPRPAASRRPGPIEAAQPHSAQGKRRIDGRDGRGLVLDVGRGRRGRRGAGDPYARLQGGLSILAPLLAETERQKEVAGTRKPCVAPLLLNLCARLRCCLTRPHCRGSSGSQTRRAQFDR